MHKSIILLFLLILFCVKFSSTNGACNLLLPSPFHLINDKQYISHSRYFPHTRAMIGSKKLNYEISSHYFCQIFLFFLSLILLYCFYLQLCTHLRYVTFNTNLSLCSQRNFNSVFDAECFYMYVSICIIGLMLSECPIIIIFIPLNSSFNYDPVIRYSLKFSKHVSKTVSIVSSFYVFYSTYSIMLHIELQI